MRADRKVGTVREGQIPIYDYRGRMRGHVSPHATAVTVARFTGTLGAKLEKRNGRVVWQGAPPAKRRRPS